MSDQTDILQGTLELHDVEGIRPRASDLWAGLARLHAAAADSRAHPARTGDPENVAERLRTELGELTGWPTSVQTFDSILAERLAPIQRTQTLLAAMGIVALALAVIGVVGGMCSHVTHRQKELAIRLALGASARVLRWQIVLAGLTPVRAGVSVGVLASWGMLKVAESQRILPLGSIASDASPYIAVAVALVAVALATLLVLSSHVGRRDPVATLRAE